MSDMLFITTWTDRNLSLFQVSLVTFEEENIRNWLSTLHCILHVLLRYFHLTNFFWMFVEGDVL